MLFRNDIVTCSRDVVCEQVGEPMTNFLTIDNFDFKGKTVLVRVDFNSPVNPETKKILDDTRIIVHGETTLKELSDKGAKIVILTHQGRPERLDFISLIQHTEILSKTLNKPVKYIDDLYGEKAKKEIKKLKNGEILVLENVRIYPDEQKIGSLEEHAKTELVKNLAPLADLFVNDAFSVAHRAHVSIIGFNSVLPSLAGRIMERESKILSQILKHHEKPCEFILGGAKANARVKLINYILKNGLATYILTGGLIGHLFLIAIGFDLGKPNMEFLKNQGYLNLISDLKLLVNSYPEKIKVPTDLAISIGRKRKEIDVKKLPTEHYIFDIGTETIKEYNRIVDKARSIIMSGPMGVYEREKFRKGTKKVFEAVAASSAFSLVGGGHTIAAVREFGLVDKMRYTTTAGGALMEFLMGKQLPGLKALEESARSYRKTTHVSVG